PDDEPRSLNEQEYSEYQWYRQRRRSWRAEQQHADQQVDDAQDERSNPATGEAADDLERAHDQALNAQDDHEHRGNGQRGQQRVPHDENARNDPDNSGEERPYPGNAAIHEDMHHRQYAFDQPVEAQESDHHDESRTGRGEKHETQDNGRNAL